MPSRISTVPMTVRLLRTAAVAAACALAGAAAAGAAGAPSKAGSAPPTGSRAGIALARRVDAAYLPVAGLEMNGRMALGGVSGRVHMRARLANGRMTSAMADFAAGGVQFRAVIDPTGIYAWVPTRSCWARVAGSDDPDVRDLVQLAINIPGGRFWAPRRQGRLIVLRTVELRSDGTPQPNLYRIDPSTLMFVTVTDLSDHSTATVRSLQTAPPVPAPRPVCGPAGPAA